MPEPGFQHKLGGAASFNPFDEDAQKLSAYTVEEITTLQSRLDKQLGPEYISSRPGAGGAKVHYLAADKVIHLANEVFGFNGWSSSIRNIQIDFVDESRESGRVSLGLSVIMRVTLKDGTYHEDVGYGHIENCKGKAAAFEKAKKEGTTDALKRALRNFGNVLGNCLYDKNYIKEVTKIRVPPTRFNPANLYRHGDVVPKSGSAAILRDSVPLSKPDFTFKDIKTGTKLEREEGNGDEYGGDEFDDEFSLIFVEGESTMDEDLPDEIVVEPSNSTPNEAQPPSMNYRNNSVASGGPTDSPLINRRPSANQLPPNNNPQTPTPKANQQYQRPPVQQNYQQRAPARPNMQPPQGQGASLNGQSIQGQSMGPPPQRPQPMQNQQPGPRPPTPSNNIPTLPAPQLNPTAQQARNTTPQGSSVGFFSARVAESVQGDTPPPEAAVFNPHHQTSIPRSLGGPGGHNMGNGIGKPDFGPAGVATRQIGMPPQTGRPQHNTTPYRPPSAVGPPQGYQGGGAGTKRLSDGVPIAGAGAQTMHRPALNDASTTQLNSLRQEQQGQYNGNDPKRLKS